jgi:hypothetical protein
VARKVLVIHTDLLLKAKPSKGPSMIRDLLFLILFFVLLGVWATSWLAFHIAGGMVHLLLVLAVIFLLVHLFRGPRAA